MRMNSARRWRTIAPWLLLVAITTLLIVFALGLPLSRLDVPYQFAGDTVDKLAQVKNVAETGWLFHNDRLGYPFGYDRLDFPRFDSLNYAIMGPIAALTGEAGIAINLYYLAGFYLVGFAAFHSMRKLGLHTGTALLCALLYSFLPYHVLRGVTHVTNGAYFLVPPAMLALAWLARNRLDDPADPGQRKRLVFALVVAVLLPLQNPYYGVFFAVLCAVAGLVAIAQRPHWKPLAITLLLAGTTAASFMAEQIPAALHKAREGNMSAVADRVPIEAEIYSLRLNQVLLPPDGHRIAAWASAKKRFDTAMKLDAPFYEVRNQYIGAIGVLGLFTLFWALARGVAARPGPPADAARELEIHVRIFALLAIAALLFAISSGAGNLIAFWVTTKIRAYNRILPYFAFPCVFAAGWAMQCLLQRIPRVAIRNVALVIVGLVGLLDVTVKPAFGDRATNIADYDRDHAYFRSVEQRLGDNAALLQFPALWYPEHPPVNTMGDYEEFKPFLLSRSLRISYGGAQGRAGYTWGKGIESLVPEDEVKEAYHLGFAAILLDGRAYANDEQRRRAVDEFAKVLPEAPSVSLDRRWWTFPLRGCCANVPIVQFQPGTRPPPYPYDIHGAAADFTRTGNGWIYEADGWSHAEDWGTWSVGTEARLRMTIQPVTSAALVLTLDTRALVGPEVPRRHLRIECNGKTVGEFDYTQSNADRRLRVDLPAGLVGDDGQLEIRLFTSPRATPSSAGLNADTRQLAVALTRLAITPARSDAHAN